MNKSEKNEQVCNEKKKSANNYKKSKVDGLYLKLVKPKKY